MWTVECTYCNGEVSATQYGIFRLESQAETLALELSMAAARAHLPLHYRAVRAPNSITPE